MSVKLVCPHCGSDRIRSEEMAVIMYPVRLSRSPSGGVEVEYTGEHYDVIDEGAVYRRDIWCRDCDAELDEAALAEDNES